MNAKSKALIATMVMSVIGWGADQWLFAPSGRSDAAPAEVITPSATSAGTPPASVSADDRLIAVRAAVAKHLDDLPKGATLKSGAGEDGFGMPSSWLLGGALANEQPLQILTEVIDPDAPSVTAVMSGVGAVVNGRTVKIGDAVPAKSVEDQGRGAPRGTGWTLVKVTSQGAIMRRPDGRLILMGPPTTKLENGEISLKPSLPGARPAQPR